MPELPEVESLRRSLAHHLVGRCVTRVRLYRKDVVTHNYQPSALLQGRRLTEIRRHGKELALLGQKGTSTRCAAIHLGMTGSLLIYNSETKRRDRAAPHIHAEWTLDNGSHLLFRDPRRFGGIWTFPSLESLLDRRWHTRGPDALTIRGRELHSRLSRTRRAIKAALLDQSVVAGLGNIYVDELLFDCRLYPLLPSNRLSLNVVHHLIRRMRAILRRAIDAGGSSMRDYVGTDGKPGRFGRQHRVYGRRGLPCERCGCLLQSTRIGARQTVYCDRCQHPARSSIS